MKGPPAFLPLVKQPWLHESHLLDMQGSESATPELPKNFRDSWDSPAWDPSCPFRTLRGSRDQCLNPAHPGRPETSGCRDAAHPGFGPQHVWTPVPSSARRAASVGGEAGRRERGSQDLNTLNQSRAELEVWASCPQAETPLPRGLPQEYMWKADFFWPRCSPGWHLIPSTPILHLHVAVPGMANYAWGWARQDPPTTAGNILAP